ncbi:MAG: polyprenyl synthetase family protein [Bacteroidaceae bacterium]|jgi:geranylgeranyl diphosphate synthase type II
METTEVLTERLNNYIASLDYPKAPQGLYEPISYVLGMGGKRIRPLLMLMSANLWKEDVDGLLPAAAGLEIYHNFTLLHDDLMDKADRRRGMLTVHKKWNDNTAILSGDAMLILSYHYFMQVRSEYSQAMLRTFSQAALEVCEGQQMDMDFETLNNVTEAEYLQMIRLKTSVLLAAALRIGAEYSGAEEEDAQLMYDFGVHIGLAFQLQDDYLDVYGNPETFGKKIGGDILCNKKTWMLIKCLELADEESRLQLRGWLNRIDFLAEEKIAAVTAIYDATHIGELAQEKINDYYRMGIESLRKVSLPEDRKVELYAIAEKMLNRER